MTKPCLSLENMVTLVTGATGGIGKAVVELFGSAGAMIFFNDLNEEKLTELSNLLKRSGIEHRYKAVDITMPGAAETLVNGVVKAFGKIDILVNCAGINRPQNAEEVTEKSWEDIFNINLKALFFVSQAAGREMIKRKKGKIINISSQAGIVALPLRAAYCSSKGGVNQLTRVLALEWAPYNINVNAVAPTFVKTPMTERMFQDENFKKYVIDNIPLGRMATPEDIGFAALFLASNLADMITGHILAVDGGWTIK
jgi:NAD(P)-dependent dehydrogenase (short-subunit alcohol dehydrogenase family)